MKTGDSVYVKGKNNKIVGKGIIESEHRYDPDCNDGKSECANMRNIKWLAKIEGKYPSDKNTSNRALLDTFLERLDALFEIAKENAEAVEESSNCS